jgi:hypothetical protein
MRVRVLLSTVHKQLEDQGWNLAVEDGFKRIFTKHDGSCLVVNTCRDTHGNVFVASAKPVWEDDWMPTG